MSGAFSLVNAEITIAEVAARTRGGDAYFYLGAGFTRVAGMPDWRTLLDLLALRLKAIAPGNAALHEHIAEAINSGSYQYAASIIQEYFPKFALKAELDQVFSYTPSGDPLVDRVVAERINALVETPSRGIVTTNYDDVLEKSAGFLSVYRKYSLDDIELRSDIGMGSAVDRKRVFLKLHGDLHHEKVLSSEEYDEVYLRNPRCRYYLMSLFLQRPIIFLGCSLEDSVLTMLRELQLHFGERLPVHIVAQARSDKAEIKARWLKKYAGVSTLYYSNLDGTHSEFSKLIVELSQAIRQQYRQDFGFGPDSTLRGALAFNGATVPEQIGLINSRIVNFVRGSQDGRLKYMKLLELCSGQMPQVHLEDLVYRISFLVNCGALRESNPDGSEIELGVESCA